MKKHKIWVGFVFSILMVFAVNFLDSGVKAADPKDTKCSDKDFVIADPEIVGNKLVIKSVGNKKGVLANHICQNSFFLR